MLVWAVYLATSSTSLLPLANYARVPLNVLLASLLNQEFAPAAWQDSTFLKTYHALPAPPSAPAAPQQMIALKRATWVKWSSLSTIPLPSLFAIKVASLAQTQTQVPALSVRQASSWSLHHQTTSPIVSLAPATAAPVLLIAPPALHVTQDTSSTTDNAQPVLHLHARPVTLRM